VVVVMESPARLAGLYTGFVDQGVAGRDRHGGAWCLARRGKRGDELGCLSHARLAARNGRRH
jgi:hypothetical protein